MRLCRKFSEILPDAQKNVDKLYLSVLEVYHNLSTKYKA